MKQRADAFSKTTVYLVRHGESDINVFIDNNIDAWHPDMQETIDRMTDPHLTARGQKQAAAVGGHLAAKLKGRRVSVMTSVLQRTIHTSAPFVELHGDDVELVENESLLVEHTRPNRHISQEQLDRGFRVHTTWDEFTYQVAGFVSVLEGKCVALPSTSGIVIFGHSLFFCVMMEFIATRVMPRSVHDLVYRLPNCSISTIQYRRAPESSRSLHAGPKWVILEVANIGHLPVELQTGVEEQ